MEEEHFSDAKFEAIFDSMKVEHPEILCREGHPVTRMCTNPLCKTSLICGQSRCASCGINIHGLCPSVTLDGITAVINQRANCLREIFSSIFELDRQLIAEIEASKKQLAKDYLHQDHLTIIHEVYQKRNPYYLNGQLARDFCQQIQAQGQAIRRQEVNILGNYQVTVYEVVDKIKRLKSSILHQLTKNQASNSHPRKNLEQRKRSQLIQQKKYQYNQKIQKLNKTKEEKTYLFKGRNQLQVDKKDQLKSAFREIKIKPEVVRLQRQQLQPIDSQVLSQYPLEQSLKKYRFLMKSLNNPDKVELLYRASLNKFSAQAFHKRCDGVPNTLTLVRTEFNKVIGGFTSYPWQSEGGYVGDTSRKAFLLSLDLEEIMYPVQLPGEENKLIYNNIHTGPRFGSGHDLFISDQCNLNSKSYAIFPTTYNTRDLKYTRGQKAYQSLSGANFGNMFRVIEYQVFRVVNNKLSIVEMFGRVNDKRSNEKNKQKIKMEKKGDKLPLYKYEEPKGKKEKKEDKYEQSKLGKKEKNEDKDKDKDKDCSVQ